LTESGKASGAATPLVIRAPDDFHVHFRQGSALKAWALPTARIFSRALVMPNIIPPASTAERINAYRNDIIQALSDEARGFTPLMAFKLLPGMKPADIAALADAGCIAGKYYPAGATTNAEDGVPSPDTVAGALSAMEERGIVLSVHAEDPSFPVMDREISFLPIVRKISETYPRLKIVVEHLSTAEGVRWLRNSRDGVAATITAHHLALCVDDMLGGAMNPHLFCKPVLKTAQDREALLSAALSGDKRFFFGSDSAPHPREKKESGATPAGIFSSPVALPILAELFISADKANALEAFCSLNGSDFYGLKPNTGRVLIEKKEWIVPLEIGGAVPLFAGKSMIYSAIRKE
jgi:dihydroorotase